MRLSRLLGAAMSVGLATGLVGAAGSSAAATVSSHVEGVLPDGSAYVMDVPANWNGTVLLYSHGYTPDGVPNPAQNAPSDAVRSALLDAGYARSAPPIRRPAGYSNGRYRRSSPPSTPSGRGSARPGARSPGAPPWAA